MSNLRRRTGVQRAIVTITGVAPQEIIPAQSGYVPALIQLLLHENNGDQLKTITIMEESEELFPFTLGSSGTIVWDLDLAPEELGRGSGLYGKLNDAGSVTVWARYVLYDERTPTNLNPATYVPSATRRPNVLGNQ